MNAWTIYLWGLAGKSEAILGKFLVFSLSVLIVLTILTFIGVMSGEIGGEVKLCFQKVLRRAAWTWLGLAIFCFAMPEQKVLAAMVIIPAIVESEVVKEDVPEIWGSAVEFLKESMKTEELPEK